MSVSTSIFVSFPAKLVAGVMDVMFMAANSAVVVITGGNSTEKSTLSPEAACCACASLRCNLLLNAGSTAEYPLIVTFSGNTLAAAAIVVFRVSSNVFLKVVFTRSERLTFSNVTVPFTLAVTLTATTTVGEAVGAVVGDAVVGEDVGARVVGEAVGAEVGETVGA